MRHPILALLTVLYFGPLVFLGPLLCGGRAHGAEGEPEVVRIAHHDEPDDLAANPEMIDPEMIKPELIDPDAIELEITDVLDLHSFPPSQVKNLVRDYLDLAYEKGLREVRIVHGKGTGTQRRMVRSLLDHDPRVMRYGDPPGHHGGWGATWIEME